MMLPIEDAGDKEVAQPLQLQTGDSRQNLGMQSCAPSPWGFDMNVQLGSSLGLATYALDEGIPSRIGGEIRKDVPNLLLRRLNIYLGLQSLGHQDSFFARQ